MKEITLIIMAAGDSTRFCDVKDSMQPHNHYKAKPHTKKQWLRLGSTPLWHFVTHNLTQQILESLYMLQNTRQEKLHAQISLQKILITASPKDYAYMQKLIESQLSFCIDSNHIEIPIQIVTGAHTRCLSLQNALKHVESEYVIVSDCARFDTKKQVLHNMLTQLIENDFDCIVPYLQVTDTTLFYDSMQTKHIPLERQNLKLIQTPQISKTKKLLESFASGKDFSDESTAIIALENAKIGFVEGSRDMAKLTYPEDIALLKRLYNANPQHRKHDTLIGHGSDIHGFIDSKDMYLCGIKIESKQGFKAHSDGDVAIHAVIDSILGAMNYGDIGELFPDSAEKFKNIDSKILLQEVYDYCLSVGLEIVNLDITIIAQTPKISPYKTQMQEMLSSLLYLPKMCVSIKATTAENLGFIGRKEGVLAQSIVQLRAKKLPYAERYPKERFSYKEG